MNTAKRFFRKYLLSGIFILVFFIVINLFLLFSAGILIAKQDTNSNINLSDIANGLHLDKETISSDKSVSDILSKNHAFGMLLNDTGNIIWEENLPNKLNKTYTSSDIAKFSKWYLEDYPVLVEVTDYGLLVIGLPKDSLLKLNFITDDRLINLLLYGLPLLFIINVLFVIVLFLHNLRKVEKETSPIIYGIENMVQGKPFTLTKNGELEEITNALYSLETNLHNKEKSRAEWINGVSHDIRTPLSIILGYASELEDDETLPKSTRKQGEIMRIQGEKLRKLIADLNLTSKLEYSMQPLNLEKIDFVELIRKVITEYYNNGQAAQYDISLNNNFEDEYIMILGDASLLMRMLSNLIQNSISHNPKGCDLTITLKAFNNNVILTVADTGIGMKKEQLDQFNNSAFSEENYTENGETAHGFGLRLVYQIVQSHNGSIHFAPNTPTGLSIEISIPRYH